MKLESYKNLTVYQKAYQLTLDVYKVTKEFPAGEMYGLVSQMRRCASSIPANIAEGYRRAHRKEYIQFIHIALGSCAELETFVSLSKDLAYISAPTFGELYRDQDDVSRLLRGLLASLTKQETKESI